MTSLKIRNIERRHRDDLRLNDRDKSLEVTDILGGGEEDKIEILAELSSALQDAGLSAHEQRLHLVLLDQRKDSLDQVQARGIHHRSDKAPTSDCIFPLAPTE